MSLKIEAIKTDKDKIKHRPMMANHVIPKHPFRVILSGPSGSGKTNLLNNLLTKAHFYGIDDSGKCYHDDIYFFSQTGKQDSLVKYLENKCKLPKKNIMSEFDQKKIMQIIDKQKADIARKGFDRSKKVLIILEDVQADKKFLASKTLKELYFMGRHYSISVILLGQSFMETPRNLRMQATNLFIFPCKLSEQKRINDEFCPAGQSKKTMDEMIKYCTSDAYSFMHINLQVPQSIRYRKNLDTVLKIE